MHDRLSEIYSAVARHDGHLDPYKRVEALCHACVELLDINGAGVMLMADRVHQGTLYSTDARIQQLEELQNAAGEGPCIDSYNLGRPVLEPDLARNGVRRWPVLAPAATQLGISALFSFPLQLDDTAVGALDLFRDTAGMLPTDQVADARLLAAMATHEVLALQSQAKPGALPSRIADLSGDRAAIEQATGMVAAQLDASVAEGGRRLREVAIQEGMALAAIAREVVARTRRISFAEGA